MTKTRFKINWRQASLGLLLFLAAYLLFAHDVFAAAGTTPEEAGGKCKDYPGLTNKIAACIRLTLVDMSDMFFDGFYKLIKTAITAFTTFVVVVYGVMTAMGMLEKPGRDTMVLALKLSLVAYFTTHVDLIYKWDMDMMDAAGSAVVSFVPQSGPIDGNTDYSQVTCLKLMKDKADLKPQAGNPVVGPWLAIDCVIDSVIGLKKEDANTAITSGVREAYNDNLEGQGMARGLLRFFFSNFQDSAIGMMIAIIGFMFIYSLLFLIIKSLFTYIGGYLAITFLMIFAPLFIPLILFRVTREYFDKWVKLLISMSLQPVIMLMFITMSVIAMDLAMFSADYSVMYKIAGKASREKGFSLNKYLDEHHAVIQAPRTLAEVKAEHDAQQCGPLTRDPNAGANPMIETVVNETRRAARAGPGGAGAGAPAGSGECQDYPLRFWHDSIDWEALATARGDVTPEGDATPAQQIAREVLSAVIFAGIVMFIMNGLLKLVPAMVNDLTGDFGVTPNLYSQLGVLPGQKKLSDAVRQMSGQMGESVTRRLGGAQ